MRKHLVELATVVHAEIILSVGPKAGLISRLERDGNQRRTYAVRFRSCPVAAFRAFNSSDSLNLEITASARSTMPSAKVWPSPQMQRTVRLSGALDIG
jgi:hypothetical protein